VAASTARCHRRYPPHTAPAYLQLPAPPNVPAVPLTRQRALRIPDIPVNRTRPSGAITGCRDPQYGACVRLGKRVIPSAPTGGWIPVSAFGTYWLPGHGHFGDVPPVTLPLPTNRWRARYRHYVPIGDRLVKDNTELPTFITAAERTFLLALYLSGPCSGTVCETVLSGRWNGGSSPLGVPTEGLADTVWTRGADSY